MVKRNDFMHVYEIHLYFKIFSCHTSATFRVTYFSCPQISSKGLSISSRTLSTSVCCPVVCTNVFFKATCPALLPGADLQSAFHSTR